MFKKRVLKPLLHGEDVTSAINMPLLNHIKFTCSEVTIPALEIEMLCCSIASWMLVRSASFILKQELTKILNVILICAEEIFLTTHTKRKKRKNIASVPCYPDWEVEHLSRHFTGMPVIKTQMASVA